MQEILEVSCRPVHDGIWTPAELMGALERAATDHADALNIGHDRMVADFGSLWMLSAPPVGADTSARCGTRR